MAHVQLLSAATATNGAPTAGDGGEIEKATAGNIVVKSTAGSGTMTVTVRIWALFTGAANAYVPAWPDPAGGGTVANAGLLNDGQAITEFSADQIYHCQYVEGLGGAHELYAEITAIGGTATAIDCYFVPEED